MLLLHREDSLAGWESRGCVSNPALQAFGAQLYKEGKKPALSEVKGTGHAQFVFD
jgi:hypothetical protein